MCYYNTDSVSSGFNAELFCCCCMWEYINMWWWAKSFAYFLLSLSSLTHSSWRSQFTIKRFAYECGAACLNDDKPKLAPKNVRNMINTEHDMPSIFSQWISIIVELSHSTQLQSVSMISVNIERWLTLCCPYAFILVYNTLSVCVNGKVALDDNKIMLHLQFKLCGWWKLY